MPRSSRCSPRWRIGGGGIITHGSLTISGVDGAARRPFEQKNSFTDFDPGLLVGVRGGIGNGWILGVDYMVTWRGDKDVTANSVSFPGTQAFTGHLAGGVDGTLQLSVSRTLGGYDMATGREPVRDRNGNAIYFSDIRLKRDIVRVGTLQNGLPLYRYRYLWSDEMYVGVMAQKVAKVFPEAVIKGADGWLRVDYSKLGIRMRSLEESLHSKNISAAAN
jgi:hypothetical protein